MSKQSLPALPLPQGVTSRMVDCPEADLSFHILEAGYEASQSRPLILLLHGFPELAFSWRKVMPGLASAGFYVVAMDQRGYGRTTGWDNRPFNEVDLNQFTVINLVTDIVVLVRALGYLSVKCVVGHDFGAVSSSMCALMRPDLFSSCVMMSHPFKPPVALPLGIAQPGADRKQQEQGKDMQQQLAELEPPRKHYKWDNSEASAASKWESPPQGLHNFLRGYIHLKSAAWAGNNPHALEGWTATELAKMPHYYIMPLKSSMPEVVAADMHGEDTSATTSWLPDGDLEVYVQEWSRTGFQGGLNWYRSQTRPDAAKQLYLFDRKKIEVPSTFISGKQDWGNYQQPGALEAYSDNCTDFRGVRMIDNAGHWPQQEQPDAVVEEILRFLSSLRDS